MKVVHKTVLSVHHIYLTDYHSKWQWSFAFDLDFCLSSVHLKMFTGLDYMRNTAGVL